MLTPVDIQCPYCGESIEILVDVSAGDQRYIEDCQVCCRPIDIVVTIDADGDPLVGATGEDEA
ncbi:MAG: CPXCG motif-containing cysteine-rich protein [Rhodanobacter sp.]